MKTIERVIICWLIVVVVIIQIELYDVQNKTSQCIAYSKKYQSLAGAMSDLNKRVEWLERKQGKK